MAECKGCKADLNEEFRFCPACGLPVEEEPVKQEQIEEVCKDIVTVEPTEEQRQKAESGFWDKVKKFGRDLPFFREALALYFMITDGDLPLKKKAAAIGAIIYFITPFDIIPDVIPVLGMLDDAGVILWVIDYYKGTMGPYFEKADEWLAKEGKGS